MPILRAYNVAIHYEVRGEGLPVVFISGFSAGGNIWDLVVEELVSSHLCVTYDNRGVGRSSVPPGPYTIDLLAGDLSTVMESLAVDLCNAVVVGHSMGGYIGLCLALQRRSAIAGLVLVSTSPAGAVDDMGISEKGSQVLFRRSGPREKIIDDVFKLGMGNGIARRFPKNVSKFKEMLMRSPPTAAGYAGQMAAIAAFDARASLSQIKCPCHVVHGSDDAFIPFSRAEALARSIPMCALTRLNDVGHFPPIEAPDELIRIILHQF